MPLLDWLRGRGRGDQAEGGAEDPQAERMEARRTDQEPSASPTEPGTADAAAEERRHEEAGRHSGI